MTSEATSSASNSGTWLERFLGSMTGRLFVILLFGTGIAAIASLSIADLRYRANLKTFSTERMVDRIESYVSVIHSLDATNAAAMAQRGAVGLRPRLAAAVRERPDDQLNRRLTDGRLGDVRATAYTTASSACARRDNRVARDPNRERAVETEALALGLDPPACWVVDIVDARGATSAMVVGAPPPAARLRVLDPWFLGGLGAALALLSFFVARFASLPVRQMATAAKTLGESLEAPPMADAGPTEVRQAARAFNTMQARLRGAVEDKSQILAAITHDLQTPLTRLRLRIDKVSDPDLKTRLLGDLSATQALVREGLELARREPSEAPYVRLALDSLLGSMADDEADVGRPVSFVGASHCDVLVRPASLRRCLANLIDNAVLHGGSAEIRARVIGDTVRITIDDEGPGVDPADLARVFEPFVRLEESRSRETGGTGLGLTIARRLAHETGAALSLVSRSPRGLSAVLTMKVVSG